MTLTVKIHKVFNEGSKVRAIASVTIGDAFAVHGVKVLESAKGDMSPNNSFAVVMPSSKYKDKYRDIFHPISRESREQISSAVLDAYRQFLSQGTLPSQKNSPDMDQTM